MFTRSSEPQSIGGVLDTGFRLFPAVLGKMAPITYASALIGALFGWLAQSTLTRTVDAGGLPGSEFFVTFGVAFLVVIAVNSALMAAAMRRMSAAYSAEGVSLGAALSHGLRRAPAVFGASILYGLAFLGGTLLLVIPGLYLAVMLGVCFYAAALDSKGPAGSLGYSWRLVRGNWWRTTAIVTVIGILAFVLYFAIGFVAALTLLGGDPQPVAQPSVLVDVVITPILSGVLAPLFYCLGFALYEDLKTRNSGTDLAERLEALETA
jgi:hypothetical protein